MSAVLETRRLTLREATLDDAAFFVRLMNEPGWRQYIREHDVRSIDAAASYIEERVLGMYATLGFALWVIEPRTEAVPLGLCGLVKRESLPDVDLGFALLAEHWGRGYVTEAAAGTIRFAAETLELPRLAAITRPDNARSVRVLERLGFAYQGWHGMPGEQPVCLYRLVLTA
jgi:RimJ/RimL family protein N-acetyltransferase